MWLCWMIVTAFFSVGTATKKTQGHDYIVEFDSEKCHGLDLQGNGTESVAYIIDDQTSSFSDDSILEIDVHYKGDTDAIIEFLDDSVQPGYTITLSTKLRIPSQITRKDSKKPELRIKTPGILSAQEFRAFKFIINKQNGEILVSNRGSDLPLMHWLDVDPIKPKFFMFKSSGALSVAFACVPTNPLRSNPEPYQHNATAASQDMRKQLLYDYDTKLPPYSNDVEPIKVKMSLTMNYFSLEENEHVFLANVWLSLHWVDSRLRYNASEHHDYLRYSTLEIWTPDVTLFNNAFPTEINHYGETDVLVNAEGAVFWYPPARVATHCDLEMVNWPYDSHVCHLMFSTWTHSEKSVQLESSQDSQVNYSQNFVKNSQWKLMSSSVTNQLVSYVNRLEKYSTIKFSFVIRRNSPTYAACIVVPLIMVVCSNLAVFMMPPSAGEKIILAGINMLITGIYLIYFNAKLPPFGNQLPALVLLYACNFVLISASILVSTVVVNFSRPRKASYPPSIFRWLFKHNFMKVIGLGHLLSDTNVSHTRLSEGLEMEIPREVREPVGRSNNSMDHDSLISSSLNSNGADHPNSEWLLVAKMINRIAMPLYLIVLGVTVAFSLK